MTLLDASRLQAVMYQVVTPLLTENVVRLQALTSLAVVVLKYRAAVQPFGRATACGVINIRCGARDSTQVSTVSCTTELSVCFL